MPIADRTKVRVDRGGVCVCVCGEGGEGYTTAYRTKVHVDRKGVCVCVCGGGGEMGLFKLLFLKHIFSRR